MHGAITIPQVYQLDILLRKISPAIWRRIWVRADSTIADLHDTSTASSFTTQNTASPMSAGSVSWMTQASWERHFPLST
jgi:hypothetical protein